MSQADQHRDKRRHARFDLLEYAIISRQGAEEPVRSVVIDVSLGGLQVRSRYQFEAGGVYELQIGRLDEEPLTIHAEVRYSIIIEDTDLYATGFKCSSMTNQQKVAWVDYVHAVFQSQGEHLVG